MIMWQGKLYDVEPCTKCGRIYEERLEAVNAATPFEGQPRMAWVCKCFTFNPMSPKESQ